MIQKSRSQSVEGRAIPYINDGSKLSSDLNMYYDLLVYEGKRHGLINDE